MNNNFNYHNRPRQWFRPPYPSYSNQQNPYSYHYPPESFQGWWTFNDFRPQSGYFNNGRQRPFCSRFNAHNYRGNYHRQNIGPLKRELPSPAVSPSPKLTETSKNPDCSASLPSPVPFHLSPPLEVPCTETPNDVVVELNGDKASTDVILEENNNSISPEEILDIKESAADTVKENNKTDTAEEIITDTAEENRTDTAEENKTDTVEENNTTDSVEENKTDTVEENNRTDSAEEKLAKAESIKNVENGTIYGDVDMEIDSDAETVVLENPTPARSVKKQNETDTLRELRIVINDEYRSYLDYFGQKPPVLDSKKEPFKRLSSTDCSKMRPAKRKNRTVSVKADNCDEKQLELKNKNTQSKSESKSSANSNKVLPTSSSIEDSLSQVINTGREILKFKILKAVDTPEGKIDKRRKIHFPSKKLDGGKMTEVKAIKKYCEDTKNENPSKKKNRKSSSQSQDLPLQIDASVKSDYSVSSDATENGSTEPPSLLPKSSSINNKNSKLTRLAQLFGDDTSPIKKSTSKRSKVRTKDTRKTKKKTLTPENSDTEGSDITWYDKRIEDLNKKEDVSSEAKTHTISTRRSTHSLQKVKPKQCCFSPSAKSTTASSSCVVQLFTNKKMKADSIELKEDSSLKKRKQNVSLVHSSKIKKCLVNHSSPPKATTIATPLEESNTETLCDETRSNPGDTETPLDETRKSPEDTEMLCDEARNNPGDTQTLLGKTGKSLEDTEPLLNETGNDPGDTETLLDKTRKSPEPTETLVNKLEKKSGDTENLSYHSSSADQQSQNISNNSEDKHMDHSGSITHPKVLNTGVQRVPEPSELEDVPINISRLEAQVRAVIDDALNDEGSSISLSGNQEIANIRNLLSNTNNCQKSLASKKECVNFNNKSVAEEVVTEDSDIFEYLRQENLYNDDTPRRVTGCIDTNVGRVTYEFNGGDAQIREEKEKEEGNLQIDNEASNLQIDNELGNFQIDTEANNLQTDSEANNLQIDNDSKQFVSAFINNATTETHKPPELPEVKHNIHQSPEENRDVKPIIDDDPDVVIVSEYDDCKDITYSDCVSFFLGALKAVVLMDNMNIQIREIDSQADSSAIIVDHLNSARKKSIISFSNKVFSYFKKHRIVNFSLETLISKINQEFCKKYKIPIENFKVLLFLYDIVYNWEPSPNKFIKQFIEEVSIGMHSFSTSKHNEDLHINPAISSTSEVREPTIPSVVSANTENVELGREPAVGLSMTSSLQPTKVVPISAIPVQQLLTNRNLTVSPVVTEQLMKSPNLPIPAQSQNNSSSSISTNHQSSVMSLPSEYPLFTNNNSQNMNSSNLETHSSASKTTQQQPIMDSNLYLPSYDEGVLRNSTVSISSHIWTPPAIPGDTPPPPPKRTHHRNTSSKANPLYLNQLLKYDQIANQVPNANQVSNTNQASYGNLYAPSNTILKPHSQRQSPQRYSQQQQQHCNLGAYNYGNTSTNPSLNAIISDSVKSNRRRPSPLQQTMQSQLQPVNISSIEHQPNNVLGSNMNPNQHFSYPRAGHVGFDSEQRNSSRMLIEQLRNNSTSSSPKNIVYQSLPENQSTFQVQQRIPESVQSNFQFHSLQLQPPHAPQLPPTQFSHQVVDIQPNTVPYLLNQFQQQAQTTQTKVTQPVGSNKGGSSFQNNLHQQLQRLSQQQSQAFIQQQQSQALAQQQQSQALAQQQQSQALAQQQQSQAIAQQQQMQAIALTQQQQSQALAQQQQLQALAQQQSKALTQQQQSQAFAQQQQQLQTLNQQQQSQILNQQQQLQALNQQQQLQPLNQLQQFTQHQSNRLHSSSSNQTHQPISDSTHQPATSSALLNTTHQLASNFTHQPSSNPTHQPISYAAHQTTTASPQTLISNSYRRHSDFQKSASKPTRKSVSNSNKKTISNSIQKHASGITSLPTTSSPLRSSVSNSAYQLNFKQNSRTFEKSNAVSYQGYNTNQQPQPASFLPVTQVTVKPSISVSKVANCPATAVPFNHWITNTTECSSTSKSSEIERIVCQPSMPDIDVLPQVTQDREAMLSITNTVSKPAADQETQTKADSFIKTEIVTFPSLVDCIVIDDDDEPDDIDVSSHNVSSPTISSSLNTNQEENNSEFLNKHCICSKTAIFVCICRKALYCSIDCQADDWNTHKSICL